jgi:hypothetical protein
VFGSEILDVAIGLTLMFLLLSLVCSSIKEALETVFKYRARDLERGIREMFGPSHANGLLRSFYQHPLIYGLFRGDYDPNDSGNLPSYIPSRTFALTLMDLVKTATPAVPADGVQASPEQGGKIFEAKPSAVDDLKTAVSRLPESSHLRGALLPLIEDARGDALRARQNIEDWYNSAMDRVSGWYKRRTQIVIALIGFAIAGGMNVDAIAITRYLNTSQTARSVMVSRAAARSEIMKPQSSDLTDPMGWLVRQGGVPIGWRISPELGQTEGDFSRDWRKPPVGLAAWLVKISGILFTGFAISLGAPFWFDVLNRFMVIRSTVKPEEKSPEEKSKA